MAKRTDDADYDAGETFENVPSPRSDAGNHDNHYGRRLRTRCVPHSRHDNKTKLRQRGQPTSMQSCSDDVCHGGTDESLAQLHLDRRTVRRGLFRTIRQSSIGF
ncbi:unnamed protein product [Protopolystoma xenopodis]|uniref:Uncharacterized protein n=1 Tax=Protopolystoma xenopodis TaxID=117903 RepID=A0A448WE69_9PLAT|nr:unnamed protein product [Protopolystoma xenopodis]